MKRIEVYKDNIAGLQKLLLKAKESMEVMKGKCTPQTMADKEYNAAVYAVGKILGQIEKLEHFIEFEKMVFKQEAEQVVNKLILPGSMQSTKTLGPN